MTWQHQAFGSPGEFPEAPEDGTGPLLDVWAKIGVRLEGLTAELRAGREQEARAWQEIRFIPIDPLQVAFAALPAVLTTTVKGGFTWAVQRISIAGIGASPDTVSLYRGAAPSAVVPQNFLNSLSAAVPAWHPGRTGLLLKPNQSLVIAGGTTGNTYTVNVDVIQVTDDQLPRFLL